MIEVQNLIWVISVDDFATQRKNNHLVSAG